MPKIAVVQEINILVQEEQTKVIWMDLETREVKTEWFTFNGYNEFNLTMRMVEWDLKRKGYEIKY